MKSLPTFYGGYKISYFYELRYETMTIWDAFMNESKSFRYTEMILESDFYNGYFESNVIENFWKLIHFTASYEPMGALMGEY